MLFMKFVIVLSLFCLSCYLFHRASTTLNPGKLNIVSYAFYLFVIPSFIGASLVYLGWDQHYMIAKITDKDTIGKTYFLISATAIILPLAMIVWAKLFRVNTRLEYNQYLERETNNDGEKSIFVVTLLVAIVCLFFTGLMFVKMGSIPLLDLVLGRDGSHISADRIAISTGGGMNQYVRNLVVLTFTPILSYLAFVFALSTNKKRWYTLFSVLFVASVFIKTYNYAKSPLAFYIFAFVIIYIVVRGSIPIKKLAVVVGVCGFTILFMYFKNGFSLSQMFDIYNGPLGRTLFTQVGTLFLHVDLFPQYIPFLEGRSFSPSILSLFTDGWEHFRSGLVTMHFYAPEKVVEGIAGVMNTLFVGEAYANFGMKGALLSIVYVGFVIKSVLLLLIKTKKTPINITIYIILTTLLVNATQGGFTDFVYNSSIIFSVAFVLIIKVTAIYVDKFKVLDRINVSDKLK
ncbi:MAG: O-antigen polymerase [Clostridium sp.]|uniref:O-antigen polymerase n=1 Tax=Clostridium sp. TaxID=1506 RepID=UPI002FCC8583